MPSEFSSQEHLVKGSEIFVGGLSRSVSERVIHELFSPYGEIIELRMIKDQNGNSKGFCFVRFASKDSALRAEKEKDGVMVLGKRIGVALSSDQDSLFFGNLHKDWSRQEFDTLVRQAFKDVVSVNLAMSSSTRDSQAGKRRLNRGFAFVQFSSHAAAARAHRVGSKPDFLLDGKWHPLIDWAEKEPEIDPEELAKIKVAFVGNLPKDADEQYLKMLFNPLGEVERVAVSRKGHFPVGFVHFARRSDLDYAIKEMNGKTVQGPDRGPKFKIQVAVARPAETGKRPRDELKTKSLNNARDCDSLYDGHTSDSPDRKSKAPRLDNQAPDVVADSYEAAVITLPAAVKERLLRVLRLGIATRYDLDIRCIDSLKELPESAAIAVLNQFMLSGADRRDKGAYFVSLLSKHQAHKFARGISTLYLPEKSGDYLPKESEHVRLRAPLHPQELDHSTSRYRVSPAPYPSSSSLYDSPPRSRSSAGRLVEVVPSYRAPISSTRYVPSIRSTMRHSPEEHPRARSGSHLASKELSHSRSAMHRPEEYLCTRSGLHLPPEEYSCSRSGLHLRPEEYPCTRSSLHLLPEAHPHAQSRLHLTHEEYFVEQRQMKFDPFTGEPYKFDPFTGEPIRPEPHSRRSGSYY
ncbi:putative RNA-binding protein 46 [Canna indica]|uniref:RNA-binding protein 46 n=1 Tax=Canna indica TaxID=4628 RepID=A0AAQ3QF31_9LILI|nr:putative RNA-binding protein 46 [Canna indica]